MSTTCESFIIGFNREIICELQLNHQGPHQKSYDDKYKFDLTWADADQPKSPNLSDSKEAAKYIVEIVGNKDVLYEMLEGTDLWPEGDNRDVEEVAAEQILSNFEFWQHCWDNIADGFYDLQIGKALETLEKVHGKPVRG